MPRELPRTANFLPANRIRGKVRTVPPMTFHHVEVDIVWTDGTRSTHRGVLKAWTETGEGETRRMTACFVEWSDGFGYNRADWLPPDAVRRT